MPRFKPPLIDKAGMFTAESEAYGHALECALPCLVG